jgi:hypothetical protein
VVVSECRALSSICPDEPSLRAQLPSAEAAAKLEVGQLRNKIQVNGRPMRFSRRDRLEDATILQ